jgi:SulP family sulfate permease
MIDNSYKPKILDSLKGYTLDTFLGDLTAAIVVAIIALPLSIALAIASGVGPNEGLYTSIVAGFVISFLGGQKFKYQDQRLLYLAS